MAKKMNKAAEASKKIDADELKRIVTEIHRQKNSASEYAGRAGQVAKTAIDRHGLNRKAFSTIVSISKLDEPKRQDFLRSLLEYAHKMDMFASVDAFDDLKDTMAAIVAEIVVERLASG